MTTPRPLRHFTKRGRVRNWQLAKRRSLAIAKAYAGLAHNEDIANDNATALTHLRRARRIGDCGNRLDFVAANDNLLSLFSGHRCKARLCVLCQQVNARRAFAQLHQLVKLHAAAHPKSLPALLTLTVPNVEHADLPRAISALLNGFRKLRKMKAFTAAIIGWRRALEVTMNATTRMFHPHFHVLVFFVPGYRADSSVYLSKRDFQSMWERATDLPLAIVDIRRIKTVVRDGNLLVGDNDGIAEVAKYIVKPHELFHADGHGFVVDDAELAALHNGLKHRRIYDFGGTMRAVRPKETEESKADAHAKLTSFVWAEFIDDYGVVHDADYWPLDARNGVTDDPPEPCIRDPPTDLFTPTDAATDQTQTPETHSEPKKG